MGGESILLGIVGIAFLSFWLAIYVFALFHLGRKIAARFRLKARIWAVAAICVLTAIPIAGPVFFMGIPTMMKLVLGFCIWMLHAQPVAIGYWAGVEHGRQADEDQWKANVELWVNEWEDDQAPEWIRDLSDPDQA